MPKKEEKILGIQYLRGIAALGVVFCHLGFSLTKYPVTSSIFNYGQYGVHLFFLISGFIVVYSLESTHYKPNQFLTFLLKRSIRIDPPYWTVIILYIFLGFFLNQLKSYHGITFTFNVEQLLAHIFYFIPFTNFPYYNHIFWTLCVEFQFYILIGLFYFLSNKWAYRVGFLILFVALSTIQFGYNDLIFCYSPIFATGISFLIFFKDRTWANAVLPITFLMVVAYKFGLPVCGLLSISCIVILIVNRSFRLLYFLGNISYSLYLTHSFVAEIVSGLIKRVPGDLLNQQILCFAIELFCAIAFACLFYVIIERPAVKFSKKFIYKKGFNSIMGL
jgi:peptidoglycan/LPS O-acetylase OafA/YrhL